MYQANQKAYEATFLKHFISHALHSAQIDDCFQEGDDSRSSVQRYLAAVSANINGITNKIIWNAHYRAVNLLTNAGKDGAPFWDTSSFNRNTFADFGPNNATLIAHKMNESWHCTALEPAMVRYTREDYFIGHHNSPFEEIDDVADTLLRREAFGSSLPPSGAIKLPMTRKGKGRGMPGASVRGPPTSTSRDKWLTSLIPPAIIQADHEPVNRDLPSTRSVAPVDIPTKPTILSDLRHLPEDELDNQHLRSTSEKTLQLAMGNSAAGLTQLEQLFEHYGAEALSDCHYIYENTPSDERAEQAATWPSRLLNDYKSRIMLRSRQIFRRALPGIRAVIAEAISQGYTPVDPDYEELIVDIESRERPVADVMQISQDAPAAQEENQVSLDMHEIQPVKKRKRDQLAPIRMFSKPIEPSKTKKRKLDSEAPSVAGPQAFLTYATGARKQKISMSGPSYPEPRQSKQQPVRQKIPKHEADAHIDKASLPPHSSGFTTLESHQQLPPNAYFTPTDPSEKPAWRCAIKHALGHYYNAGDRKNCPGCFTALSDSINAKIMDFYLPSRTHFHQSDPTSRWRPSKPFGRARRSKHLSHNSIAKEAYWSAVSTGSNPDEALQIAVDTVTEHIKPKVVKEPTPEPIPSPEPDLGPHPSGSATMEQDQDIPSCVYFTQRTRHEEPAWRCDINHALGRYYLAGDKRTCPGCGSNKSGQGKHEIMDFYLPEGVVVRQEADGLSKWKPRKPYKVREGRKRDPEKSVVPTHNQLASRKYWEAIEAGKNTVEAYRWAVEDSDRWLDEKEEEAALRLKRREKAEEMRSEKAQRKAVARHPCLSHITTRAKHSGDKDEHAGYSVRYGKNTNLDDDSDENLSDAEYQVDNKVEGVSSLGELAETSSDDETSSAFDSE